MEMHAHVPKMGRTLGHWLLEGFFIVISALAKPPRMAARAVFRLCSLLKPL
jgi:hypothetical protein